MLFAGFVMVTALYRGIIVSKFELYYVHFRTNNLGKCVNLLILSAMG